VVGETELFGPFCQDDAGCRRLCTALEFMAAGVSLMRPRVSTAIFLQR
jgi:hypothetical protein